MITATITIIIIKSINTIILYSSDSSRAKLLMQLFQSYYNDNQYSLEWYPPEINAHIPPTRVNLV